MANHYGTSGVQTIRIIGGPSKNNSFSNFSGEKSMVDDNNQMLFTEAGQMTSTTVREVPSSSNVSEHEKNHNGISPTLSELFHCHNASSEARSSFNSNKRARLTLWLSVGVCLFFMICEVVGGLWAQSLAIITDAAHLLTDLASMLISLFSLYIAVRPASQRMSFGWHRAEVLGAFISVFLIWIVTGILVYLAIQRIITGEYEIEATIMTVTAGIGVCVNLVMGLLLYVGGGHSHSHSHFGGGHHGHSHGAAADEGDQDELESNVVRFSNGKIVENELLLSSSNQVRRSKKKGRDAANINVRAAFIHVLGDLIQSIGVLIAGLLILTNEKFAIADPICTLIFSVIVLSTTIYIVRDALVVLLEGRPSNIDFRHVFDALENIEGVQKVHDLRIWALTVQKIAISVHLEVDPQFDNQRVLRSTTLMLRGEFNAHETTIQIEGYQPESKNCNLCIVPQS